MHAAIKEQEVIDILMSRDELTRDAGLLSGEMGIALYFFCLGRIGENQTYSDYASELIDYVSELIQQNDEMPIDFANGLAGIGWAIEYLIQNKYIEADADEILEDIDLIIHDNFYHRNCDFNEMLAIGYYLVSRLGYRVEEELDARVLNLKHLAIRYIERLSEFTPFTEHKAVLVHLLKLLYKLNLYNYKIEQMLEKLDSCECEFIIPMLRRMSKNEINSFNIYDAQKNSRWGLQDGLAGIGLQILI